MAIPEEIMALWGCFWISLAEISTTETGKTAPGGPHRQNGGWGWTNKQLFKGERSKKGLEP